MAKREFSKISPAVWRSSRLFKVSNEARLLHFYFMTCRHQTSAGCFALPEGYACSDLAWSPKEYQARLAELVKAELIAYDAEHETVYVLRWFQHNAAMNDKHAAGTRRQISEIESDTIRELAEGDFEEAEHKRRSSSAPPQSDRLRNSAVVRGR